jgi:hypothetical protein
MKDNDTNGSHSSSASAREITWHSTGDGEIPYEAKVDGQRWTVQVNDFPAEALYTLIIDGTPVEDLEDWPSAWQRPKYEGN